MKLPRLRTRLTLWFGASVLTILAPFLAGILYLEWRSMRAALDHHLSEDLETAWEMLVVRHGEVVWRTDDVDDVGYDAGTQRWIEAYDPSGRALFLRGVPKRDEIRAALPPPFGAAPGFRTLRTPAGAFVRLLTSDRRLNTRPVRVRVARTEDELRAEFSRLILLFAIGAPLAVLAAAAAGYVISGRALSPLARMADRARDISADHLTERLPVENPHDELGQLALVFNDTFARLADSFDRLKQFTADASHELRTPLTAIRSVGEVALRDSRDAAGYQDVIGSMLEEADRLSRVVDTLLTLSRWESGRVRPNPEPVDLRDLVAVVTGQLSILAEEGGVTLDLRLPRPAPATVDPLMVRQAISNVLDNAIKFTPPGGRVTISTEVADGEARVVVDDEGPGIPAAERRKVLERFYRIDAGREGAWGGTGLGLAIVQRAVTANGGRVSIDSSPGGGARVVLAVPAA